MEHLQIALPVVHHVSTNHLYLSSNHLYLALNHLYLGTNDLKIGINDLYVCSNDYLYLIFKCFEPIFKYGWHGKIHFSLWTDELNLGLKDFKPIIKSFMDM